MRKAFLYGLSLAMLLSLAACHKPQAGQQDTSQPDPATTSTSADVSSPEPVKGTPDPVEPEEPEDQPSDTSQAPQTQDQPKLSAKERVENSDWFKKLVEDVPGTWVDDTGCIHSPVANGSSGDIMG